MLSLFGAGARADVVFFVSLTIAVPLLGRRPKNAASARAFAPN